MNMEFKPDALKDLSDCKTSINQDGLHVQLKFHYQHVQMILKKD